MVGLEARELEEAALQRGMQKGMQKGIQKGIRDAVDMLRKFGHQDEEIKLTLMNKYDLSAEETEKYFQ